MEKIIDIVKNIVYKIDKKVKRIYWTNEEIDKYFAKRSAISILDSETTCFMNPCLDLTLASAAIMHSKDIPHVFVIEEHLPTKEFPFNRLHFALEFKDERKNYVLNYKTGNRVYISEGNYNGRKDIPMAQIMRIPGKKINPYKTIYKNLGYDTLEELIKNKFKGYSLENNLNRLKRDNSEEEYKSYKTRCGEKFNIIIEPQNQL